LIAFNYQEDIQMAIEVEVKDLLAIIDAIPGVSVDDPKLIALVQKHKGVSTDYRIVVDFFPPGVTITHLASGEGVRLPLQF
jgi:hypothetical protein